MHILKSSILIPHPDVLSDPLGSPSDAGVGLEHPVCECTSPLHSMAPKKKHRVGAAQPDTQHAEASDAAVGIRVAACTRFLRGQTQTTKVLELLGVAGDVMQAPPRARLRAVATSLGVTRANGESDAALHEKVRRQWFESIDGIRGPEAAGADVASVQPLVPKMGATPFSVAGTSAANPPETTESAVAERLGTSPNDAAEARCEAARLRADKCKRLLQQQLPGTKAQELLEVADDMVQAPCQNRLWVLARNLGVKRARGESVAALHDKVRSAWLESVDSAFGDQVAVAAPGPAQKAPKTSAKESVAVSTKGGVSRQHVRDALDHEGAQRERQCFQLLDAHRRTDDADLRKAAEHALLLAAIPDLCYDRTRNQLDHRAGLLGFEKRMAGEAKATFLKRLAAAWEQVVVGGSLPCLVWWTRIASAKLKQLKSHQAYQKDQRLEERLEFVSEQRPRASLTALKGSDPEWWASAGCSKRCTVPAWCSPTTRSHKTPAQILHYNLSHRALLDADAVLHGLRAEASVPSAKKILKLEFFAMLRDPLRRDAAPYPQHLASQCGLGKGFLPHQCLRQLALIQMPGEVYQGLPLDHARLLANVVDCCRSETLPVGCIALSDVKCRATRRHLEYADVPDNCFSNARFLSLAKRKPCDERSLTTLVEDRAEAEAVIEHWVGTFLAALEDNGIHPHWLKPNHLAVLSVFHAKFVREDDSRPMRLARWCWGLPKYLPGSDIQSREHLASQCLPRHYDDSGLPVLDVREGPGQAIACAPVTCELCHIGLQGYDALARHCRKEHGNYAEYRKCVFWMASGLCYRTSNAAWCRASSFSACIQCRIL